MKKILTLASAVLFAFQMNAQDLPMPSPSATAVQTIGLNDVTVTYSRPSKKGRTIWGDLVPFDKIWRLGANGATNIHFDGTVKINGTDIPEGDYSVFAIPGKSEWTIMINSVTGKWGTDGYEEANNLVSVKATPAKHTMTESMLIYFDNLTSGSADMVIAWDEVAVSMTIETDYMGASEKNIESAINELDRGFRVYNNAANFYIANNTKPEMALEYAKKSVEMEKRFWNIKTLSEAYAMNEDYKMAIETAQESLKMAEEAEYAPYIKMNTDNIDKWKKMK